MQLETPSTAKQLSLRDLGRGLPYEEGMAIMRQAMADVREGKTPAQLLLLEHANTITKTRQHQNRSFRLSEAEITARGIVVFETDRGGDVTFHGEGQLVGYLVMPLGSLSLEAFVRTLEAALIEALTSFGLPVFRIDGKTGIWIKNEGALPKKLVAIGVGVSGGVTRHGFALNVTTALETFTECIVPCGLEGYGVTSLEREMPDVPALPLLRTRIAHAIAQSFGFVACNAISE